VPKPEMVANAGIYALTWAEHNLAIRVDRIREHSDVVSGEVTIRSAAPGQNSHLHQARLNITSTAARKQLANFMEGRYGPIPPWSDVLEQLCVMVLTQHREGEPIIRIGDLPRREALLWRVYPLLVEDQANMVYGAGQTGKSMLAVYLSVLLDSGINENGLTVEPGKVLYVDYETDELEVSERVKAIQAGIGLGFETDIIYRFGRLPLADDIEQVQRAVIEHGVNLVVVDSLGMAAGGDQDKSTDIIRYFQALRTLRCTTLTIDHLNKEGKLYGNVYKFNESRCIWQTKSVSEPGQSTLDIGLYHRKMNNGRLEKPLGFKLEFGDGVYTVSKQDVMAIPDLASEATPMQQIHDLLRHTPTMTAEEIGSELSLTTKNTLAILRNGSRRFQRSGNQWQLKETLYSPGRDSP